MKEMRHSCLQFIIRQSNADPSDAFSNGGASSNRLAPNPP